MKLHISKELALPRDTVTSTIAVFGGKGMGKTNLGSVLVEELTRNSLKWSALDPLGVWWGVRHSGDGKGPGIECVVLGGAHGDMPIEPGGGTVVADLVVDEPGNVVVDFSRRPSGEMWSVSEKVTFVRDYAKRLFQRQGGLINGRRREPFMQILDEAARYVPQVIPHGNPELAACLGAWETLVEEGRNIGIGVTLLTQRSARIAKSVTEISDAMFSFRIVGPNSIRAVTDWLGEHVPKEQVHKHVETLRSLERGHCLVVSPGWLKYEGVIAIRARETFDSSATPAPGERAHRVTGQAAKPDLDKYMERMKETIERAQANDPAKLKARIRELEGELRKKQTAPSVQTKVVTQRIGFNELNDALDPVIEAIAHAGDELRKRLHAILDRETLAAGIDRRKLVHLVLAAMKDKKVSGAEIQRKVDAPDTAQQTRITRTNHPRPITPSGDRLPIGELAVLKACAQYPDGLERNEITVLTGYKRSSRDAYIARLRQKDFVNDNGKVSASDAGLTALGNDYEPLPSRGEDLQRFWLSKLPEGEKRILQILLEASGKPVEREALDQATGYRRSSRDAYLARLNAKRLVIPVGRGQVKASETLFA